jgi:hypothetical protein
MKPKTTALSLIAALSFISGAVLEYTQSSDSPVELAFLGAGTLLVFYWYHLDSSERGYKRTALLNIGVIALAILALPYYFFRSRGARGGLIAMALFIVTLIGVNILAEAGQYLTHYALKK